MAVLTPVEQVERELVAAKAEQTKLYDELRAAEEDQKTLLSTRERLGAALTKAKAQLEAARQAVTRNKGKATESFYAKSLENALLEEEQAARAYAPYSTLTDDGLSASVTALEELIEKQQKAIARLQGKRGETKEARGNAAMKRILETILSTLNQIIADGEAAYHSTVWNEAGSQVPDITLGMWQTLVDNPGYQQRTRDGLGELIKRL